MRRILYIAVETSHLLDSTSVTGVFDYMGLNDRYDLSNDQSSQVLNLNIGDHVDFKGSDLNTIMERDSLKIQRINLNEDIVW